MPGSYRWGVAVEDRVILPILIERDGNRPSIAFAIGYGRSNTSAVRRDDDNEVRAGRVDTGCSGAPGDRDVGDKRECHRALPTKPYGAVMTQDVSDTGAPLVIVFGVIMTDPPPPLAVTSRSTTPTAPLV